MERKMITMAHKQRTRMAMKGQRKRNELSSNNCRLGWSMIISIMLHVTLYNYKQRVLSGDKKWNTCSWIKKTNICVHAAHSRESHVAPLKTGAFHSQKSSLKQGDGGLKWHSQCSCCTENHENRSLLTHFAFCSSHHQEIPASPGFLLTFVLEWGWS